MMMAELKEEDDELWTNLRTWIFGLAFGYTLSLGIGFLLHTFA